MTDTLSNAPGLKLNKYGQPIVEVAYQPAGAAQVTVFAGKNVPPPSPLYIQRDDQLFLTAIAQVGASVCTITIRLLLAETERIQNIQVVLNVPTALVAANETVPLAEGYLLSVAVQQSTSSAVPQMFVQAAIGRTIIGAVIQQPGQVLIQNYVGTTGMQSWPGSVLANTTDGPGMTHLVTVANPGPGADWVYTVPAGIIEMLVCMNAVLTTAVAVANREPALVIDDGANVYFVGSPTTNIPASTTANVSGAQLTAAAGVLTVDVSVPMPPNLIMSAGQRVRVSTLNIQGADQWTAIRLFFREWFPA